MFPTAYRSPLPEKLSSDHIRRASAMFRGLTLSISVTSRPPTSGIVYFIPLFSSSVAQALTSVQVHWKVSLVRPGLGRFGIIPRAYVYYLDAIWGRKAWAAHDFCRSLMNYHVYGFLVGSFVVFGLPDFVKTVFPVAKSSETFVTWPASSSLTLIRAASGHQNICLKASSGTAPGQHQVPVRSFYGVHKVSEIFLEMCINIVDFGTCFGNPSKAAPKNFFSLHHSSYALLRAFLQPSYIWGHDTLCASVLFFVLRFLAFILDAKAVNEDCF